MDIVKLKSTITEIKIHMLEEIKVDMNQQKNHLTWLYNNKDDAIWSQTKSNEEPQGNVRCHQVDQHMCNGNPRRRREREKDKKQYPKTQWL